MKLNSFGVSRALTALRLQGEDSEEISNDTDTDDMLRSLAAAEMVAPRFRWRRSRWGRLCPVELYNGNIVNGSAQYSVGLDIIILTKYRQFWVKNCQIDFENFRTYVSNDGSFI